MLFSPVATFLLALIMVAATSLPAILAGGIGKSPTHAQGPHQAKSASLVAEQKKLDELSTRMAKLIADSVSNSSGARDNSAETLIDPGMMRESFYVRPVTTITEPDNVAASSSTGRPAKGRQAPARRRRDQTIYNVRATEGMVRDILVAIANASGRTVLVDKGIPPNHRLIERLSVNMSNQPLDEILDVVLGLVELEYTLDQERLTILLPKRKGFASQADYLSAKAVEAYTRSLMYDRDSPFARTSQMNMGEIYRKRYRYSEAIEKYQEVIHNHPGTPEAVEAHFHLGQVLLALEDFGRCRREILRFIDAAPDSPLVPKARLLIGHTYSGEGKFDEAARWYRLALKAGDPAACEDALMGMGLAFGKQALARQGRAIFAKTDYEAAEGSQAPARLWRAIRVFNSLITQYPRSKHVPEALFYQAASLVKLGESEKAQGTLRYLISRYPRHEVIMPAYFQLADSLYQGNKVVGAIEAYTGALEQFPNSKQAPEAHLRLARLYNGLGLFILSRQTLKKLVSNPDTSAHRAEALQLLAQADHECGNLVDAQQHYTTLAREMTGTLSHQATLNAARLVIERGEHRQALDMLFELIKANPEPDVLKHAYRAAARCYIALGHPEKALVIYQGPPKDTATATSTTTTEPETGGND